MRQQKSFTLMEIVIAITIFMLFLGGIMSLMRGAPKQFEETAKQKAADTNAQTAVTAMVKDLRAAVTDARAADFKGSEMKFHVYRKSEKENESDLNFGFAVHWHFDEGKKSLTRAVTPVKRDDKGEWQNDGPEGSTTINDISYFQCAAKKLEGSDLAEAVGVQVVSNVRVSGEVDKSKSSLSQTTIFLRGATSVGQQPRWNTNELYTSKFVKITGGRFVGIDNPFDFINELFKNFDDTVNAGIGDFVDTMKAEVSKNFKDKIPTYATTIQGAIDDYKKKALDKFTNVLVHQSSKIDKASKKFPQMIKDGLVGGILRNGLDYDSSEAKNYGSQLLKSLEGDGKDLLATDKLKTLFSSFNASMQGNLNAAFERARGITAGGGDIFTGFQMEQLNAHSLPGGVKLQDIYLTEAEIKYLKDNSVPKSVADATGLTVDKIKGRVEKLKKYMNDALSVDDEGKSTEKRGEIGSYLEKYFHMLTEQGLHDIRKQAAEDALDALAQKAQSSFSTTFRGLISDMSNDLLQGWPSEAKKLLNDYEDKLAGKLTKEIFGEVGLDPSAIKNSISINKTVSAFGYDLFGSLKVKGAGNNTIVGDLVRQVLDPEYKGKTYHEKLLEKQGKDLPNTEKDWAEKQLEGVVNRYFEGKKENTETGQIDQVGRNLKKDLYANFGLNVEETKLSGTYASKQGDAEKESQKAEADIKNNLGDFQDY